MNMMHAVCGVGIILKSEMTIDGIIPPNYYNQYTKGSNSSVMCHRDLRSYLAGSHYYREQGHSSPAIIILPEI